MECSSFALSVAAETSKIQLKGTKSQTLDQILSLDEQDIDIATAALILSSEGSKKLLGGAVDISKYQKKLDDIAKALSEKLGNESSPDKIVEIMNDFIYKDEKYIFDKTDKEIKTPENAFLNCVLENKKGNCLGLSILYLSLAERLGIPLRGAATPIHVFVRFEKSPINLNIETTDNGKRYDNELYRKIYHSPQSSKFYLRSLTKKKVISLFLTSLATFYMDKGLYEDSTKAFEKAIEISPDNMTARNNLALLHYNERRYDQAWLEYDKILEETPDLYNAINNRGMVLLKKGHLKEAGEAFQKALELYPRYLIGRYNYGLYYMANKQEDEAIFEFKNAIAIDPNFVAAHINLGVVYKDKGLQKESMQEFQEALLINPRSEEALTNLGNVQMAKYQFNEAITTLKKVIEINPKNATAYNNLAVAYFLINDQPLAMLHLAKALQFGYPVNPKFLNAVAAKQKAQRVEASERSIDSYYEELGIKKNK